jgi:hypothetical protein
MTFAERDLDGSGQTWNWRRRRSRLLGAPAADLPAKVPSPTPRRAVREQRTGRILRERELHDPVQSRHLRGNSARLRVAAAELALVVEAPAPDGSVLDQSAGMAVARGDGSNARRAALAGGRGQRRREANENQQNAPHR